MVLGDEITISIIYVILNSFFILSGLYCKAKQRRRLLYIFIQRALQLIAYYLYPSFLRKLRNKR